MGVPPEKVADVMALMGDSIDNIPGAKGIGEKGARELIRAFRLGGSGARHAAEVEGKRYREALLNSREQVVLSKQLATIAADAPGRARSRRLVERANRITAALRDLYAELGFTSLLRDLPAATTVSTVATDYAALDSPAALCAHFSIAMPRDQPIAVWLTLEAGRARNRRLRLAHRRL